MFHLFRIAIEHLFVLAMNSNFLYIFYSNGKAMASVDGSRSLQSASDETILKLCDACNYEGTEAESSHFCDNCKEFLCQTCTAAHKKFKNSRNHTVMLVSQLSPEAVVGHTHCTVLCECNRNTRVTEYCENHNVVFCQTCKTTKHRRCKTESVTRKSIAYDKTEINATFQKANAVKDKIDKFLQERNTDLQNLVAIKETCTIKIHSFREELNKHLDFLEEILLKEMEAFESQERREIEDHISSCAAIQQVLQTDIDLLENVKKTSLLDELFLIDLKVSAHLDEYEILLHNISQETNIPTITFERNRQLVELQNNVNELGTLTTGHAPADKLGALTTGHAKADNLVTLTTGHAQADKLGTLTTGHAQVEKLGTLTTGHSQADKLGTLTTGHAQADKLGTLTTSHTQADKRGTLTTGHAQADMSQSNFSHLQVQSSKQVDITSPEDSSIPLISGCDILQDRIILCDNSNRKLKLLDSSFALKDILNLRAEPWDVSVVHKNKAIITLPYVKQLQYIEVLSSLKSNRVIKLDRQCWGVHVAGEEICVSVYDEKGGTCTGEVRIVDFNGNLIRKLGVNKDGSFMFGMPYHLTVSQKSRNIYVSDYNKSTLTCSNSDGTVVYRYTDQNLVWTRGVLIDVEDNILVCGSSSHNVQIVTADGRKRSTLLTAKDGIKFPYSIAYRHTDNTLIVGLCSQKKLFVYTVA